MDAAEGLAGRRPELRQFLQGAVVKDDIGRYAAGMGDIAAQALEGAEEILVGIVEGRRDACLGGRFRRLLTLGLQSHHERHTATGEILTKSRTGFGKLLNCA